MKPLIPDQLPYKIMSEKIFVKKVHPQVAAIEAGITQAAHELSQQCSLFYSPRVLDCDLNTGTLQLEHIYGIISLKDYLHENPGDIQVLQDVGQVLAYVHNNLNMPKNIVRNVPRNWRVSLQDTVAIHGDFNMVNVCYRKESRQIVILDWATGPALPFRSTIGPRQLDLAQFIRSLLLQQKSFISAIRLFSARKEAFLRAYAKESKEPVDLNLLGRFLSRINIAILYKQFRRRMPLSILQTLTGQILLKHSAKQWKRKMYLPSPE